MLNEYANLFAACHLCANPVLVTAKEAMMHATITDWQLEAPETPESFCENVKTFFEDFKMSAPLTCDLLKRVKTPRAL